MTKRRVSRSLRRTVIAQFGNRCAYCHTLTSTTGAALVIDHVVPEAAGGQTVHGNLCVACHSCNEFKGAQTQAKDPSTGEIVPLFHPCQQRWNGHFRWSSNGSEVTGHTPTGRATVVALNLNHRYIVEARRRWVSVGWHPPPEDA